MTPQLWLLCGLAYSVGVVLLLLKVERTHNRDKRLSSSTVLELMQWSHVVAQKGSSRS